MKYSSLLLGTVFFRKYGQGDIKMCGEKVSYKLFRQKLIEGNNIYENNFYIEGSNKYDDCWIGLSKNGNCKSYWFGMISDEENDYEYKTADEILNAKVFDGKSMHELWDKVYFNSINGVSAMNWVLYNCFDYYYCREQDVYNVAKLAIEMWNQDYKLLKEKFLSIVQTDNNKIFTAYYQNKMIAFAHCSIRKNYVEGNGEILVGYIETIYVEKEYRKNGIASHLISYCENWAKSKGCKQIESDCSINNNQNIEFYLFNGFKESSKLVHFIKNI